MSHLSFTIQYVEGIPYALRFAPKWCNSSGTFNDPLAKALINEVGIDRWHLDKDGQLRYDFDLGRAITFTPQDAICLCNKAQEAIEALMDEADRIQRITRATLESRNERSAHAVS